MLKYVSSSETYNSSLVQVECLNACVQLQYKPRLYTKSMIAKQSVLRKSNLFQDNSLYYLGYVYIYTATFVRHFFSPINSININKTKMNDCHLQIGHRHMDLVDLFLIPHPDVTTGARTHDFFKRELCDKSIIKEKDHYQFRNTDPQI